MATAPVEVPDRDGWYAGATDTWIWCVELALVLTSVTVSENEPLSATVAPSSKRTITVEFLVHVGKTLSTTASTAVMFQTLASDEASTERLYEVMLEPLFSTTKVTLLDCPGTSTTCWVSEESSTLDDAEAGATMGDNPMRSNTRTHETARVRWLGMGVPTGPASRHFGPAEPFGEGVDSPCEQSAMR